MRAPGMCLAVLTALLCPAGETEGATTRQFLSQGSLLVNRGARVVKVPLRHTAVKLRVSGHLAQAEVTQVFDNPHQRKVEAIYAFPLPSNSAVWSFTLKNGQRVIQGRILPRARAKAIYRRASLAGKVAALLTQEEWKSNASR